MALDPTLVMAGDLTVFVRRMLAAQLVIFSRLPPHDREAILRVMQHAGSEFFDAHTDLLRYEAELEQEKARSRPLRPTPKKAKRAA